MLTTPQTEQNRKMGSYSALTENSSKSNIRPLPGPGKSPPEPGPRGLHILVLGMGNRNY